MNMAHIGIDARLTYYRTGGISTYIRRLVSALEVLDTDNQYTLLYSRKDQSRLSARWGAARLWTPAHHRIERLALAAELLPLRLDVLHSPDFIPPYRSARRHIITVHDLTFLHYPAYLTAASRRYYNGQIRAAVRAADHILAVSAATRQDLISLLDVPAAKITIQPHGAGAQYRPLPPEQTAAVVQQLGLPPRYLLHVGTLEPRKNIAGLVEAYHLLRARLPDAPPLVLVGQRGWLFETIEAAMAPLQAQGRLHWRTDISDEQLPSVYNGALALAAPSFYEGFGMPVLEAMACGVVPVVSHTSAFPEVVGDLGLQIDPHNPATLADALYRALTDSAWRAAQQPRLIARAAQFTWEESARIAQCVYMQA